MYFIYIKSWLLYLNPSSTKRFCILVTGPIDFPVFAEAVIRNNHFNCRL